jgi:hypothetical protein
LQGYASDSFGFYNPTLVRTQFVCLLATLSGLFLTSFLIGTARLALGAKVCFSMFAPVAGVLAEKILPTRFEKQAVYFLDKRTLRKVRKGRSADLSASDIA